MYDNNHAVFLTNLSSDARFEHIKYYMEQAARVRDVHMSHNKTTAIVYYYCLSDAIRAIELLDGTTFFGRRLFVQIHKDNAFMMKPYPQKRRRDTRDYKNSRRHPDEGSADGANDGQDRFVTDFVKAWAKVMDLDRFDLV